MGWPNGTAGQVLQTWQAEGIQTPQFGRGMVASQDMPPHYTEMATLTS